MKLAEPLTHVDTLGDDDTVDDGVIDGVAAPDRETRGLPLSLSVEETSAVADDVAVAPMPGDAVRAAVTDALGVSRAVGDASPLSEGELVEDGDIAAD